MAEPEETGTVKKPVNTEPEPHKLLDNFITPADDSFSRNHGPIPTDLSASTHVLTIEIHPPGGQDVIKKTLLPKDLAAFPQHTVVSALQCAGNRRHAMRTRMKEVQGIDWFDGAISNCEWQGPLVADVLKWAGVDWDWKSDRHQPQLHAAFACHQQKTEKDSWYGGSVPLLRVMSREHEAVLALKMNGDVLTKAHGFPVRAIVPGIIGARSVKWLDTIVVSSQESQNFYQQRDYKVLPPDATSSEVVEEKDYWSKVPPMQDNKINSIVGDPEDDETARRNADGKVHCRGYALPGADGGPVVKVEVSGDEGENWVEARLGREGGRWSWRLWEADVAIEPGEERRIFCRATDAAGHSQNEERSEWNLRGVGYNGYESTVKLRVV